MSKPRYKKYLLPGLFLLAAIGGIYSYLEYNRKPADLMNTPAQETITATELVNFYDSAETTANKKFLGKVIQVTGVLSEIDKQDTLVNVLLSNEDDMHKVSCLLDKNHTEDISQYIPGSVISIKGICTGYLLDVELNRCVIVSQRK